MYPNLKLQLWRSGIRQNRLAQMVGIHETALSRMINGFREPGDATRAQIARILKSDEEWLFTPEAATDIKRDPGGTETGTDIAAARRPGATIRREASTRGDAGVQATLLGAPPVGKTP
jgi:transcriptional regulator with XRE-family HTH domain